MWGSIGGRAGLASIRPRKPGQLPDRDRALSGKRIAVVEDNFIIRSEIELALERAGAVVVSLFDSMIDGAILDVVLEDGATSLPVARELDRRRVAFLFYTGQPDKSLRTVREELPHSPIIAKPADSSALLRTIARLIPERQRRDAA